MQAFHMVCGVLSQLIARCARPLADVNLMSLMGWFVCGRHGLGHWDQLAGDLRLGLAAKLEAAATEKRGKNYEAPEDHKMLPKGAAPASTPSPRSCQFTLALQRHHIFQGCAGSCRA